MTDITNAPERIRVAQDADGFWTCREAISGSQEYVRADIYDTVLSTLPIAVEAPEGWGREVKPFDMTRLFRHAFEAGKAGGLWVDYDPTELGPYKRIDAAIAAFNHALTASSPGKDGGQEVEAVAYRYKCTDIDGNPVGGWHYSDDAGSMGLREPLYARPQPASTALVERLEAERAEQWNLRRDAEGSRDAARAAADSLRIERDALRTVLSDVLSGWDFWDVNPHDREPPRDAISRARGALFASQTAEPRQ